jgi:hypothetical protein
MSRRRSRSSPQSSRSSPQSSLQKDFDLDVHLAVSKFKEALQGGENYWSYATIEGIEERKVSMDWNTYKNKPPLDKLPRLVNGFGGWLKYIWVELKANKEPDPDKLFYAHWNGHNFSEDDIHKRYEVYEPVYLPSEHLIDQETTQTINNEIKVRLKFIDTIYKEFQKVLKQEYEYQKKFCKERGVSIRSAIQSTRKSRD